MTYDIFISYAREDYEKAKIIAENLKEEGYKIWWDHSIPAGKTFDDVIEEAIRLSKCVLVLWSSHSIKSNWVRLEAEEGRNRSVLIPIFIEDVSIPFAFKNIQTANLINWNKDHEHPVFKKLIADINLIIGNTNTTHKNKVKKHTKSKIKQPSKKLIKRFYILTVGIGLVLSFLILKNCFPKGSKVIEENSWNGAKKENTIGAYNTYIIEFPVGKYLDSARIYVHELKNIQRIDSLEALKILDSIRVVRKADSLRVIRKDSLKNIEEQKETDRLEQKRLKDIEEQKEADRLEKKRLKDIQDQKDADEVERIRINSNRMIRITLIELVCEKSDDEGPSNDADMDRFEFTLNATQNGCRASKSGKISSNNQTIYNYNGVSVTTGLNHYWRLESNYTDITYDNEHCNLNSLSIVINGYAREEDRDSSSQDETARNSISLNGNDLFKDHTFRLNSEDFIYRCKFKIEKIGW